MTGRKFRKCCTIWVIISLFGLWFLFSLNFRWWDQGYPGLIGRVRKRSIKVGHAALEMGCRSLIIRMNQWRWGRRVSGVRIIDYDTRGFGMAITIENGWGRGGSRRQRWFKVEDTSFVCLVSIFRKTNRWIWRIIGLCEKFDSIGPSELWYTTISRMIDWEFEQLAIMPNVL